jgi:hypothetical protein
MSTPTPDQDGIRELQDEAIRLAKGLRGRIPSWAPDVSREFTTATYGILGKCSDYTERLLRHILLLLIYRERTTETQPDLSHRIDKSTMGELVRLIKAQQRGSAIFQQADRKAVGAIFRLLDDIVRLRNNLIHVRLGGASRQAETDLRDLLKCVDQFCDSWLLDALLGER